jgi:putative ABC transport system permease protein
LAAALLFTFLPLIKLGDIPPNAVLSDDIPARPRRPARTVLASAVGVGLFFLLVLTRLSRPGLALAYVAGLSGVLAAGGGLVAAAMAGLRKGLGRMTPLIPRLAARGLARPRNLNDAAVLSIALSLAVLVVLFLLQNNLRAQMIESFPPEAPNAFFINIQPSQAEGFRKAVGRPDARLFPLARGRVVSVNEARVQDINRRAKRDGDRLTREFGFTFGPQIFPTDKVVEGPGLWDPDISGPQVSVFDEYRDRFGLRRGDQLTISVLGRRFTATISSFRSINQSVRQPFFYFHFKPGLLDEVPHTLMGGLAVPRADLPGLQNGLAEAFPNITVVDLSDVAELTGKLFGRLGRVVGALGLFGLSSGVLLLLSSLLASLASRTRDAALFAALGADRGQVARVALLEYALVGFTGALAAGIVGIALSGLLLRRVFDLPLLIFPLQTGGLLIAAVAVIVSLSWLATRRAFQANPMEVLRHE